MDDINNAVVHNGPDFRTFEDLQRWARGKITEAAPFNGDGQDGRVMWHRKPARGWQPDWSNAPLLSIERGGAEHRWGPQPGTGVPGGIAAADPFDRVLAAWSEEDITAIMQSKAYLRSSHPDHAQAQALVRAWFERRYRDSPGERDADGAYAPGTRLGAAGLQIGWSASARTRARAARSACARILAPGRTELHGLHMPSRPSLPAIRFPTWKLGPSLPTRRSGAADWMREGARYRTKSTPCSAERRIASSRSVRSWRASNSSFSLPAGETQNRARVGAAVLL